MDFDVDIGRIQKTLRGRSRGLFGKRYRLEVIAAVGATGDPIWSRGMAQALGLAENQMAAELKALAQLDALRPFPLPHNRRKLYQLAAHPVWGFARELVERTIADLYPEQSASAISAYWSEVLAGEAPRRLPSHSN